MSEVQSIALTAEQIEVMNNPDADWLKLTPEQEGWIRSAAPGQATMVLGGEILRMPAARLEEIMSVAFKAAATQALEELNLAAGETFEIDCEEPELGQWYVRVIATATDRSATATAMIPDPRAH